MKDEKMTVTDDPSNYLPDSQLVGRRVGWLETYRSETNVLGFRTNWGLVIKHFYHNGGSEGFEFNGWYLAIIQEGYDFPLYIRDNEVVSAEGINLITEDEDLADEEID